MEQNESVTLSESSSIAEATKTFFWFGFLFGGFMPIALLVGLELFDVTNFTGYLTTEGITSLLKNLIFQFGVGIILFLAMLASAKRGRERLAKPLLYLAGALSMLTLHHLVANTGGSIQSLFASYYLYTPVVVALAFNAQKGLIIVAFLSLASFFVNTFHLSSSINITSLIEDPTYKLIYVGIFVIQLITTVIIEFKSVARSASEE